MTHLSVDFMGLSRRRGAISRGAILMITRLEIVASLAALALVADERLSMPKTTGKTTKTT
jgi:hypothetical protein